MNLSQMKAHDTNHEYDQAHAALARLEQEKPCTCMLAAQRRSGSATMPSLVNPEDLDPDCELHFPWIIEDPDERLHLFRYWMMGYQVGYSTGAQTERELRSGD